MFDGGRLFFQDILYRVADTKGSKGEVVLLRIFCTVSRIPRVI